MKHLLVFITSVLICACSCTKDLDRKLDQDFLGDLGSENNRINGDLYLDYFNNDLSNLTYDYYLTFITDHEAPSAKGLSAKIKSADYCYFVSQKRFFVVALYYKNERTMLCDNSGTAFLDSVKTFGENETVPDLPDIAAKILNK